MSEVQVRSAATRVARAAKAKDPAAEVDARRDLAEAKIADYVTRCLAQAPPLSDEQRTRLAELLRPVRAEGQDDPRILDFRGGVR
ncbi:hypothetical protein QGN32_20535 [Mycolicibacterium sp. ND9-15]|uniref:hypothetical protein n=1 Tax=Mycolicibacterium sp. ND9-15 TaxID=3042320 RepID=UPI002DD932E9|nr:hypothetical protein [Mycolicibacterium sp. ND9-15]WSE55755.1 hypothetical protein QGN32_20535 [Mycolicibacterium sp. ND9-15]